MASLTPLTGTLGKRLAKHLLHRTTYNINKHRIEEFSKYTIDEALDKLAIIPKKRLNQPIHWVQGDLTQPSPWIDYDPIHGPVNLNNGSSTFLLRKMVISWWLDEARHDTSYRSKMTYFLFTNFTLSSNQATGQRGLFYDYLKLLERFCLGDWKEFVFQVTKNSLMLLYLNNNQNTKWKPNENYARELLELFTIGKGPQVGLGDYTNYTEEDVVEGAKVLTGWTYKYNQRTAYTNGKEHGDIPCGYANIYKHEFGKKQFSSRFNNHVIEAWDTNGKVESEREERMIWELKDYINMILNQDETAKFVCRKLYRFFVARNITTEIENDIIVPLATTFRENYNLEEVITQLFKSQHFFDADDSDNKDEIIGGLIKSPLNLGLQTLNLINYPTRDPLTDGKHYYKNFYYFQLNSNIMSAANESPFDPPSVAGFPANYEAPDYDKFWFNTATIIPRYGMITILLNSKKTIIPYAIATFVDEHVSNPYKPEILVRELTDLLFPEEIDQDRLNYFVNDILLDNGSLTTEMWADEWSNFKTGNNPHIEDALQPLLSALLWSQEYQNH